MSFAERHKRWLLPLLGLAGAGVLWLNFGAGPAQDAPETQTPQPPAGPAAPGGRQTLEEPPPQANATAPLLLVGRQALSRPLREPPRPPELHPELWRQLPEPRFRLAAPAGSPPAAPLVPPPPLDFLIETAAGREAWIQGQGYRPGAVLAGGYRLKRITASGVVLSGPGGELERPLHPGAPSTAPKPKDSP